LWNPGHGLNHGFDFLNGQNNRNTNRPVCANGLYVFQWLVKYLSVEKQKGVEGLILRRGRNVSIDREVAQELLHLARPGEQFLA